MSVTIKKIAELSGVSRGTVDRVLNHRGRVKPETAALVRSLAEQYGYIPNLAGKALAVRKKSLVIGVILVSEGNPFFDGVLCGIRAAEKELQDYGVQILLRTMKGYDSELQLQLINEIEKKINVLVLNAISDNSIAKKINDLDAIGIKVVTLNTDIENSKRMCYIGSNYYRGGETACGIMGMLTHGKATVGVVTGSAKVLGHNQRIIGFNTVAKHRYPGIKVLDSVETNDDDACAYEVTKQLLRDHPEIDAVFIVAAGVYGACRAIMALGLDKKLTVISFDQVPTTVEMIKKGLIQATICQQPFMQGNKAIHIAFNYLVSGSKPDVDKFILENQIKILENLSVEQLFLDNECT